MTDRRNITEVRLRRVREHLIASGTESLLGDKACIYATGSVGRGEASEHSDLDVFVIGEVPVDTVAIVDRLTAAAAAADFLPFSKHRKAHLLHDLIGHLGTQEDDHTNVLTAERRLRNYKLKNSRLLTCYSAILYLAWVLRARDTVTPADAIEMARLTPTQRLEFIRNDGVHAAMVRRLLEMYTAFLEVVDADKRELLMRFADDQYHPLRRAEAVAFGDAIFLLLNHLAGDSKLLRYLLV